MKARQNWKRTLLGRALAVGVAVAVVAGVAPLAAAAPVVSVAVDESAEERRIVEQLMVTIARAGLGLEHRDLLEEALAMARELDDAGLLLPSDRKLLAIIPAMLLLVP